MPLQPPPLDQRDFEDLVREARLRIPRYTREWTDFNDSDPGMALVQLFAWFTEQMLFQLNQVPLRNYTKMLEMLNLRPLAARPATAHVSFRMAPDSRSKTVPVRSQLPATGTTGDAVTFETTLPLDLIPYPLKDVLVYDGRFINVSRDNERTDQSFHPLGTYPQLDNALYLGFEPIPTRVAKSEFPAQWRLCVFLPEGTPSRQAAELGLTWEYLPGGEAQQWRPLGLIDETARFSSQGYMIIEGPQDIQPTTAVSVITEPRYWLRCRLTSGTSLVNEAPRVAFLRPNTVPVENLVTVRQEDVGPTDGATRDFALQNGQIQTGSLQLILEVDGRSPELWREVPDFFDIDIKSDSAVYLLDPATGGIKCGDGKKGRLPEPGGRFVAREYRHGGGSQGNIAAATITAAPSNVEGVEVNNDRPASGGQDEEPTAQAIERAPLYLRSRGQAVTADDFKRIAEDVAGVDRAIVLPCQNPDYPAAIVPGAVQVVIVPSLSRPDPPQPPDPPPELLARVRAELDRVRLITTEVRVTGPEYYRVTVAVTVLRDPLASASQVQEEVRKRIKAALRPRAPGTPPPARPVVDANNNFYPSALVEVILGATDPRSNLRLVQVVIGLEVKGATGAILELKDVWRLKANQILWCDDVIVDATGGPP